MGTTPGAYLVFLFYNYILLNHILIQSVMTEINERILYKFELRLLFLIKFLVAKKNIICNSVRHNGNNSLITPHHENKSSCIIVGVLVNSVQL